MTADSQNPYLAKAHADLGLAGKLAYPASRAGRKVREPHPLKSGCREEAFALHENSLRPRKGIFLILYTAHALREKLGHFIFCYCPYAHPPRVG